MTRHFLGDTAALLGRSLRHISRSPDTIITTAIMPIAFLLLFVYVFGGAIETGSDRYVNYLLPGILLITVASGISYTAYRLFLDLQGRHLRAVPVDADRALGGALGTRADLAGRQPDLARGGRAGGPRSWASARGPACWRWLAVAGIMLLFTLALTWLAVIPGLTATSVDGASAFSYPLILLPFVSSAFVPTDSMPGPVRAFAEHQPVTSIVEHHPRPVRRAAGRRGHLDRPRLVRRPPRRRVRRARWPSTAARSVDGAPASGRLRPC